MGPGPLLEPRSKELAERRHGGLFLSIGHGQQLRRPKHDAIVSRPSRWPSGATPSHTRPRRPAGCPQQRISLLRTRRPERRDGPTRLVGQPLPDLHERDFHSIETLSRFAHALLELVQSGFEQPAKRHPVRGRNRPAQRADPDNEGDHGSNHGGRSGDQGCHDGIAQALPPARPRSISRTRRSLPSGRHTWPSGSTRWRSPVDVATARPGRRRTRRALCSRSPPGKQNNTTSGESGTEATSR